MPAASETVAVRASWPAVCFLEDLAPILGVKTTSAARRVVLAQGIGHGTLGRRMFVRREALAAWFAARESSANSPPPPVPEAPQWAKDILSRRRGR